MAQAQQMLIQDLTAMVGLLDKEFQNSIKQFKDYISTNVLAKSIKIQEAIETEEINISEENKIRLFIEKN